MTPAARDAQIDFVRLSSEEPSSLYFEDFLRSGFAAWPTSYQDRFPALHTWTGVSGLKRSIRELVCAPDNCRVLFASRSLSLVELAASCMFRVCRNVLATDLSWPTYERAIRTKARRTRNRLSIVPLRDNILYHGWSVDDVAQYLAKAYVGFQCDGLFLPAIDHLGIRLPLSNIVGRIREQSELRFCFVDAAQALCHVPMDECLEVADFVVTGSHKWMGAYLPMGIGLYGQARTNRMIDRCVKYFCRSMNSSDPLLHFTQQLETDNLDGHSETVNLAPLLTCAGATVHKLNTSIVATMAEGLSTDEFVSQLPRPTLNWQIRRPREPFRSRIVLFESQNRKLKSSPACPTEIRQSWLDVGCIVTGYPSGMARISLPC